MNASAYHKMAREILWLLLRSGSLQTADKARIIAYHVFRLPPVVRLALPDRPRYHHLLHPLKRQARAELLAEALLDIVQHEERDNWTGIRDAPQILMEHGAGRKPEATAVYDPQAIEALEPAMDAQRRTTSARPGEALLRVTCQGRHHVLEGGEGMMTVGGTLRTPRITFFERLEEGIEVAYAISDATCAVHRADGREARFAPGERIPISHDTRLWLHPLRRRFWLRAMEVAVEVMGEVRTRRPALSLINGRASVHWERNAEPTLDLDDVKLRSGALDAVEIERVGGRPASVVWFDDRELDLESRRFVPFQGSHLKGLRIEGAHTFSASVDGVAMSPPPRVFEVHGVLPVEEGAGRDEVLFGFEAAQAEIYQDALLLDGEEDQRRPLRIRVRRRRHVGPLFRVALDGCSGAKVLPLSPELRADGLTLEEGRWVYVEDVVRMHLSGVAFRLEILDRPRIVFDEAQLITRLSADPDARWRVAGWHFRTTAEGLEVGGRGRAALRVDHQTIEAPTTLPVASVHRIEVGSGRFRLVRGRAPAQRDGAPP